MLDEAVAKGGSAAIPATEPELVFNEEARLYIPGSAGIGAVAHYFCPAEYRFNGASSYLYWVLNQTSKGSLFQEGRKVGIDISVLSSMTVDEFSQVSIKGVDMTNGELWSKPEEIAGFIQGYISELAKRPLNSDVLAESNAVLRRQEMRKTHNPNYINEMSSVFSYSDPANIETYSLIEKANLATLSEGTYSEYMTWFAPEKARFTFLTKEGEDGMLGINGSDGLRYSVSATKTADVETRPVEIAEFQPYLCKLGDVAWISPDAVDNAPRRVTPSNAEVDVW
jgi:hypothetical protein